MSDGTAIEWADATWNPVTGCSVVSPGCTNCYAMRLAGNRLRNHPSRQGLTEMSKAGPVWTGEVRFNEPVLDQPLRWRRPRRIFVCAHGDLFHENVPDAWIDRVFSVMARAPQHVFLVLTKRPARMLAYRTSDAHLTDASIGPRNSKHCWPHVWLGVSVEDQRTADERIPILLATPAARRWISAEPLLGPVDLRYLQPGDPPTEINALAGTHGVLRPHGGRCDRLDWVVVGGESGPGARQCDVQWIRDIVRTCAAARTPCFVKQLGSNSDYRATKKGADPMEWPADLRVRQCPWGMV